MKINPETRDRAFFRFITVRNEYKNRIFECLPEHSLGKISVASESVQVFNVKLKKRDILVLKLSIPKIEISKKCPKV